LDGLLHLHPGRADGRTPFRLTAGGSSDEAIPRRPGRVETVEVAVP
jgi:hypothetical protein